MTTVGRRIRAALAMGLMWALAWAVAGAVLGRIPRPDDDVPLPILFAPLGFLSGVLFAGFLMLREGRRTLDRLSLSRMAGWGTAAGLTLAVIIVGGAALGGHPFGREALLLVPGFTLASAACAAGTLALARRGERSDALPEVSDAAVAERHRLRDGR